MTSPLACRSSEDTNFDLVVLGEVLLRFDPGDHRIRSARSFTVSEGGGEYNVGRALRKVFGKRVALATAIGDNELGLLLEDLLQQGGLNLDFVVHKPADEVGHLHRNPTYFAERGFGVRAPRAMYDRASTASSLLHPDDIDWDHIFGNVGVRWFHTGGIFAGLSDLTASTVKTAMSAAKRHGTIVSYDINYRPALWNASSHASDGMEVVKELAEHIDVLFGVQDVNDLSFLRSSVDSPMPSIVATTERTIESASVQNLAGHLWSEETGQISSHRYTGIDVFDRIGSGDAFASGIVNSLLDGLAVSDALEIGVAHALLAMTTPGDTSSADVDDIERIIKRLPPEISR